MLYEVITLVIHNAPFDLGFLDYELSMAGQGPARLSGSARVLDTLELARDLHPGQRNNLDALCRRYDVDNSSRTLVITSYSIHYTKLYEDSCPANNPRRA